MEILYESAAYPPITEAYCGPDIAPGPRLPYNLEMPVLDLNSQLRSALRAAAHPLKPVVLIGDKGLSDAVLQEIDRNLTAHGLIKVRAGGEDRAVRDELLYRICDELACAPVHHLGKIFILFRPTERDPDATALLGARKAKSDVAALGTAARKANEAHVPKKLAVVGKPAPTRSRSERPERERDAGPMTARERYLGTDKRQRPSTREETGSRRGAARTAAPRRPGGLGSTLGAARKSADRPAAKRAGSALSLRAGARTRPAGGGQRTTATSRKPRTATKK